MPSPPAGFVLDDEGEVVLAAPAERRTLTIVIHDPITNRSLDCVIRRAFSNSLNVPFFLLHPLDTPIMFFRISGRTGELQEVDDEEAERIIPAAAYALAKKSLHLTPTGFTLTLRGAICFTEDDVINLDTELGFGIGGSLAEGVDITTFLSGGQEYMIYTPFDPLMFVVYKDPKTSEILVAEDPELLNDPKVLDAIDEEQQFQAMVVSCAAVVCYSGGMVVSCAGVVCYGGELCWGGVLWCCAEVVCYGGELCWGGVLWCCAGVVCYGAVLGWCVMVVSCAGVVCYGAGVV
ncbi:unnamed protein product [Closterium sp. Naga37s-1]|nr:unnamed protein product [Closterium sp. Naga37s-1]